MPRVTVLRRVEGHGMRRFLNEEEVLRAIADETGVHRVTWVFPHRQTPALETFASFCSFDILITPYTAALSNLWIARPGSSVIEIQGKRAPLSKKYISLSDSVNVHHQIVRSVDNGSLDDDGSGGRWKAWDHIVNVFHFRIALRRAMKNLRKQKIIVVDRK